VLQTNNIHIAACAPGEVTTMLGALVGGQFRRADIMAVQRIGLCV
jgi:hypothetical protein